MTQNPKSDEGNAKRDIAENKIEAAVSYLWAMSLVMFFYKRSSPFVHFHARIGIVLFILSLSIFLFPENGFFIKAVIGILSLFGILTAAQGMRKGIPFIGEWHKGNFIAHSFFRKFQEAFSLLRSDGLKAMKHEQQPDRSWIQILGVKKEKYEPVSSEEHQKIYDEELEKRKEYHEQSSKGKYKAKVNNIDVDPRVQKRQRPLGEEDVYVENRKKMPWM